MQQWRCLDVSLSVLTTWTVLDWTGIPRRHQVNVAGSLVLGLVDGGSVMPQELLTTTSPDRIVVSWKMWWTLFHLALMASTGLAVIDWSQCTIWANLDITTQTNTKGEVVQVTQSIQNFMWICKLDCLIDWLSDWLTDWSVWFIHSITGSLIHQSISRLNEHLIFW